MMFLTTVPIADSVGIFTIGTKEHVFFLWKAIRYGQAICLSSTIMLLSMYASCFFILGTTQLVRWLRRGIFQLNIRKFQRLIGDERGCDGVGSSSEHCAICLDPYEKFQSALRLNCGHVFHEACLVRWLKISNRCPLCSRAVVTLDIEEGAQADHHKVCIASIIHGAERCACGALSEAEDVREMLNNRRLRFTTVVFMVAFGLLTVCEILAAAWINEQMEALSAYLHYA